MKFILGLLAAAVCVVTQASETGTLIFNLPLGGQLKPTPRECTVENITTNNNKMKINGIKNTKLLGTTGRTAGSLALATGRIFRLWHFGHWYCMVIPHL